MAVTSPPSITALPTPPDPDDRATFNSRAYPWSVAQQTLATEVGAVATNVYNNATDAASSATSAAGSASAASTSATNASNSATAASGSATAAAGSASTAQSILDDVNAALVDGPVISVNGRNGVVTGLQEALVSGTSIKTINGASLLGAGDITISSPGALLYLAQFSVI